MPISDIFINKLDFLTGVLTYVSHSIAGRQEALAKKWQIYMMLSSLSS